MLAAMLLVSRYHKFLGNFSNGYNRADNHLQVAYFITMITLTKQQTETTKVNNQTRNLPDSSLTFQISEPQLSQHPKV